MRKSLKTISFLFLFILLFFCFSNSTLAGESFFDDSTGLKTTAEKTGHTKQAFFNSAGSLESGIGNIVFALLSLVGIIFLFLLIYGGIFWMTARGNESQVDKAKNIITNSLIGLIIVLLAYAISVFVIKIFV